MTLRDACGDVVESYLGISIGLSFIPELSAQTYHMVSTRGKLHVKLWGEGGQ